MDIKMEQLEKDFDTFMTKVEASQNPAEAAVARSILLDMDEIVECVDKIVTQAVMSTFLKSKCSSQDDGTLLLQLLHKARRLGEQYAAVRKLHTDQLTYLIKKLAFTLMQEGLPLLLEMAEELAMQDAASCPYSCTNTQPLHKAWLGVVFLH